MDVNLPPWIPPQPTICQRGTKSDVRSIMRAVLGNPAAESPPCRRVPPRTLPLTWLAALPNLEKPTRDDTLGSHSDTGWKRTSRETCRLVWFCWNHRHSRANHHWLDDWSINQGRAELNAGHWFSGFFFPSKVARKVWIFSQWACLYCSIFTEPLMCAVLSNRYLSNTPSRAFK